MRILDLIAGVTSVTALVVLPFSLYNFYRHPIRSFLAFGIPVLVSICAFNASQKIAQSKVLEKLDSFSEKFEISINATPVSNPNQVLLALKTLRWLPAHHSNPTKRINVEIYDDRRHIAFSLARDSGNPQEYWVFYPKYYITTYNEIGRIVTLVFDNY